MNLLETGSTITSCNMIKKQVEEEHGIKLNTNAVRDVFKKEMGLGYRQARAVPIQGNTERSLVLR